MTGAKISGFVDRLRDSFRKTGTLTSFIFINGCIFSVITLALLFFTVGDQRGIEARTITRDLLRTTETSIADMEKTVRGLGYFYSALNTRIEGDTRITENVQRLLADDTQLLGILWATEKGVWQQRDMVHNMDHSSYEAVFGWPSYQELYRAAHSTPYNTIGYLNKMPWSAFQGKVDTAEERPVGLTMRLQLPDGTIGVLLVVTTPERIFGSSWSTQREDIARITIKDRQHNQVMLDNRPNITSSRSSVPLETVNYVLQLGDKMWDIQFEVYPSLSSLFLSMSPWLAFGLLMFLTTSISVAVERKNRQDLKIAEMSKNLEGAHHELQTRISERDKLFHALRKSERENRAVINSVSDIIFETDENGKIVFLNETWKRITGMETADTLGKSMFDMLDQMERGRQQEMFEELVRGERQAYRAETKLDLGHGLVKPIEMAFSMLRMAEDKSIRVVGTITDIEKRRRAELAVREAEHRFRAIFENSISGIYQISPEGRFVSANTALAEVLGYDSPDDLMRSIDNVGTQLYVSPEDREAFIQKLLFEGRVSGVETEVRCKNGKTIWILENARVVRSERGGVQYYEGSVWDVTTRKEAEEAMRMARLQAEISSRSRMEFLANMSHELRTPLNAVIGFSEIIKGEVMGPLGQPVYKEYAQDIFDSGNYLLKVISEILEVSKIETGNRELNQSNFRLTKALKSCMTIMSSRVDEAGVTVAMEMPDTLPELLAEELGFKQIMLNLIGNAIKFTPRGGKVTVGAVVNEAGEMVIDITDTGIGMTDDEMVKAMQPFSKVDNNFSTMKAGTGLGLTIVDSLVRLHGGKFQLMSKKGEGTTARVIMPSFRVLASLDNIAPVYQAI